MTVHAYYVVCPPRAPKLELPNVASWPDMAIVVEWIVKYS